MTTYKGMSEQKSSWRFHMKYCKEFDPSHESFIKSLSLEDSKNEMLRIFTSPESSEVRHIMVPLLKHMRQLFDERVDDPLGEVESEFMNCGRDPFFQESMVIESIWSMPGMANYLLSSHHEDLLDDKSRYTKKFFSGYCKEKGAPHEDWINHYVEDKLEKKRLREYADQYHDLEMSTLYQPSSMKFCYIYFGLIVAAAVRSRETLSSIHDGLGGLRLNEDKDNIRMTIAALRRAMQLWVDNFARGSCGDAMASAASLAFTAMQDFSKFARCNDHPKSHLLEELKEFELVPGLDIDDLVITCLSEFAEHAASSKYSWECLDWLANNRSPLWRDLWDRLPVERRAKVVLGIISHMYEHGTSEALPSFEIMNCRSTPVPRNALLKILDYACGEDLVVLEAAARDETLGPKNPGKNLSPRRIVHFCIRNLTEVKGTTIVAAIDELSRVPHSEKAADGIAKKRLYAENECCRKLALGGMRDSHADFFRRIKEKLRQR